MNINSVLESEWFDAITRSDLIDSLLYRALICGGTSAGHFIIAIPLTCNKSIYSLQGLPSIQQYLCLSVLQSINSNFVPNARLTGDIGRRYGAMQYCPRTTSKIPIAFTLVVDVAERTLPMTSVFCLQRLHMLFLPSSLVKTS